MSKRPNIKGRGADIYLASETKGEQESVRVGESIRTPKSAAPRRMVTTYLPLPIVERLQEEWLKRVRTDTKAQKAHIITEALEHYFKDLDNQTSKHSDGDTSQHSNVSS